ncbi:Translation initiation factor eIF-2B subunit gamma [Malassezia psittaci]|uniref:Translation initiation factor eIF2B subunit gamma n=1 Tax=Malassezia psittaci TaxID=1821823 RepID=A0AAF0JMQ3_9BASI|nr:Translation initiation factor eIF-2B subunit gamma [Malassezia psittaci]
MAPPSQAPHAPRFQPVIFSDAGSNLYPLCETRSEMLPKALIPVLNRPMIAFPLQWIVSAGFRTCLLVAPIAEHASLANALRTLCLVPPNSDGSDLGTKPNVAVSVKYTTSANGPGTDTLSFSPSSAELTVELVPYGPKVGEPVRSLLHPDKNISRIRWGTTQLLYWLAATRKLERDPLVVPVDLIAPQMPLSSFLATHLASLPEPPTVSCLFYERGAGEGTGKERERDGPANLFTAYVRNPVRIQEGVAGYQPNQPRSALPIYKPILIMDSDDVSDKNASDLELRMSLLWKYPNVRISTTLLDSYVYVLRLAPLLPLLETHAELNSITDQLVPFVVKCGWQTKLSEKASWYVTNSSRKPDAMSLPDAYPMIDLAASMSTPYISQSESLHQSHVQAYHPRAEMVISRIHREPQRPLAPHVLPSAESNDKSRSSTTMDEGFMARANTVPTYLECNRYLLRQSAAKSPILSSYPLPIIAGNSAATADSPIHPKAQLSTDCIVGTATQIEERATIKHSIIGRQCRIGKNVRIMRSVLMDHVIVGDNAKLENCIVGFEASIGDRAQLKETDVGPYYVVSRGVESKNEKLVAYDDDDDDDDDPSSSDDTKIS